MSKKHTTIKLGFRRRLTLYYSRVAAILKAIILLIVVLMLFTNFFKIQKQKLLSLFATEIAKYGFIFENLIIEGQRNIPSNDIIDAIGIGKGKPIYSLNLDDIRARLEDNPWVRAALVERRLPDTLYIAIAERKPIAIWQFQQKLYLIDEEGVRITSREMEKFSDLLHVVGEDADVYARTLLIDLERHQTLKSKIKSAIRYGKRRWDLNLEQKINVKMPEKDFNEAYDYLDSLNKKDKLFNQNYKSINLKDPNKYYIEKY